MKRVILTLVLAVSLCLTTAGAAHADPVSMIAAVLVTALGEGAAIAVATFIVNTAIYAATSLGVTAVTSALSGKNKAGIAERQASVTRLSLGELPRELLIGEVCTAGTLVDGFNFGGKYGTDTVTRCVAVADHAIESVVGYYVDDQFYPWTVDGIQPGFSNKLSIRFYNATVDGHAPQAHVLAAGAGWTNADRLAGIAVFWIDTQYDEKVWSQGHPEIKFVLRGIRAYDMRFDPAFGYAGPSPQTWEDRASHTYTRNAAILRYAFTRGIFAEGHHGDPNYLLIGRGLTAEEAPPERIIAAANLCDEMVNGQPRYTANGVIRAADDFITVEEMFAAAMAGQIVQREGGVEVEPGQAKAAVVTITDGDLVPGEPVSFSAFLPDTDGGRINTVIPRYVSPAQNWKDHAGAVRRDPAHIIADGGPREVTLPLILVTSSDQADRCAEITRLLARLERRASIVLPPEYATLEEGDWIAWRSDRHHGGATVRYRIESWSLDEKWRQHLSLREIASSVFGVPDPIEDTAKVPPPPMPLDALSLDGVTAEAITLPGDTSAMPAVRFTWDTPVDAAALAIRAEVRRAGETEIATGRADDISLGGMVMSNGVPADAAIEARLVPIGEPSRPVLPSLWITLTTTTLTAGDISPGAPIGQAVALNTEQIASEILRGALYRSYTDGILYLNGVDVGTYVTQKVDDFTDDLGSFAGSLSLLGAKNAAGTSFILNADSVMIPADPASGSAAVTSFRSLQLTTGENVSAIQQLLTVTDGFAETKTLLVVNGVVTGIVNTNDGSTGALKFQADTFAFVDPNGGNPRFPIRYGTDNILRLDNVVVGGDLIVEGTLTNEAMVPNTITGISVSDQTGVVTLTGTTPKQVCEVWIQVERPNTPVKVAFNGLVYMLHDPSGSFTGTFEFRRSSDSGLGVQLRERSVNAPGNTFDALNGTYTFFLTDAPGPGIWRYFVRVRSSVNNMTVQTVTDPYIEAVEYRTNTV